MFLPFLSDFPRWLYCVEHYFSHIREHLDGRVKMSQDQMSEEELQFHYFKLHDYDNNNKLDGIELTSAVTHFHSGILAMIIQSAAYHHNNVYHDNTTYCLGWYINMSYDCDKRHDAIIVSLNIYQIWCIISWFNDNSNRNWSCWRGCLCFSAFVLLKFNESYLIASFIFSD